MGPGEYHLDYVEEIRVKTAKAIESGKKIKATEDAKALAKSQKELAKQKLAAKKIIENIPPLCEESASLGLEKVVIMSLVRPDDYNTDAGFKSKNKLAGVGKLVFDFCEEAGFKPTVEGQTKRKYDNTEQIVIYIK